MNLSVSDADGTNAANFDRSTNDVSPETQVSTKSVKSGRSTGTMSHHKCKKSPSSCPSSLDGVLSNKMKLQLAAPTKLTKADPILMLLKLLTIGRT